MRKYMNNLSTLTAKDNFATRWGMDVESPPLLRLAPALDIILTRPSDPAHSEFGGLAKSMHILLLEAILAPSGVAEYVAQLRRFPFPPGWPRLQSPTFVGSYTLSEHGRWSVIAPILLRL